MTDITKFRFLAHKVMPLVYDESLSYYEFLCKVIAKLNEVIDNENSQNQTITEFGNEMNLWESTTDAKYEEFVRQVDEAITEFEEAEIAARGEFEESVIGRQTEFEGEISGQQEQFEEQINGDFQDFFDHYLQTLGVVQVTGTSTTDVMSQKAVTDTFDYTRGEIKEVADLTTNFDLSDLVFETGHYVNSSGNYVTTTSDLVGCATFIPIPLDTAILVTVPPGKQARISKYLAPNEETGSFIQTIAINNTIVQNNVFSKTATITGANYIRITYDGTTVETTPPLSIHIENDNYNYLKTINNKANIYVSETEQTSVEATQYAMKNDGTNYTYGYKKKYAVQQGDKVKVSGYCYNTNIAPLFLLLNNDAIAGQIGILTNSTAYTDYVISIPVECDEIVINGQNLDQIKLIKLTEKSYALDEELTSVEEDTAILKTKIESIPPVLFGYKDFFEKLADTYVDDFLTRLNFIDSTHEYTVIGDDTVVPTIETGVGAYTVNASNSVCYVRPITKFPFFVSVGHMDNAATDIKVYTNNIAPINTNLIHIPASGSASGTVNITFNGNTYGPLNFNTKYFLYCFEQKGITVYDDIGNSAFLPIEYTYNMPKQYGLFFGTAANRKYGVESLVEFTLKDIAKYNIDKIIEYGSQILRYTNNTTIWPDIADNPYISLVTTDYTNNKCLELVCDNADNSYRTECRIDLHNSNNTHRLKFSACYYAASSDNLTSDYHTYIFQIHDDNFVLDGWTDPPPVHIYWDGNNKLYAQVDYIASGEIPTANSEVTRVSYLLGDMPFDEWFKIDVEARVAWKNGMLPMLKVWLNNEEKVNITLPVGYNIISSGGDTHLQFGLYAPQWRSYTYDNMSRKIKVCNIKAEEG